MGKGPVVRPGEPIGYRIRRSPRARNVRLRLSARDGLTVVVPKGFDLRRLPAIVEGKRDWIHSHLRRWSAAEESLDRESVEPLPERLDLPALGESWCIEYRPTRTRRIGVLIEGPGRLAVYGAVQDPEACREAMKRWLHLRAREELAPWLAQLARQHGFEFKEIHIRGQRTRWASCSSNGLISLSYKLLFLDRDTVRCILLHELCHTVFLDHSSRFWELLQRLEPRCRVIHKEMRDSWKQVPAWAEERDPD